MDHRLDSAFQTTQDIQRRIIRIATSELESTDEDHRIEELLRYIDDVKLTIQKYEADRIQGRVEFEKYGYSHALPAHMYATHSSQSLSVVTSTIRGLGWTHNGAVTSVGAAVGLHTSKGRDAILMLSPQAMSLLDQELGRG